MTWISNKIAGAPRGEPVLTWCSDRGEPRAVAWCGDRGGFFGHGDTAPALFEYWQPIVPPIAAPGASFLVLERRALELRQALGQAIIFIDNECHPDAQAPGGSMSAAAARLSDALTRIAHGGPIECLVPTRDCPDCEGTGMHETTPDTDCERCNGTGEIEVKDSK